MKEKSLAAMQSQIVHVFKNYEKTGTNKWTYEIATKDLSYQLGSLIKRVMQLKGERFSDGLSKPEIKHHIGDELADILAEVLFISHELDIDIHKAWEGMVKSDNTKISSRSKKPKK